MRPATIANVLRVIIEKFPMGVIVVEGKHRQAATVPIDRASLAEPGLRSKSNRDGLTARISARHLGCDAVASDLPIGRGPNRKIDRISTAS